MSGAVSRASWHAAALLGLLFLTAPLAFCLLVSLADSASLETPLESGRASLRWYATFFSDARWTDGLWDSLRVACVVVPLALLGGTGAAYAFERWRFPGRALLGAALLAPLFVPPVVLGLQLLALHQRVGLWGSPLSVALAHNLWATPVVFVVMRAAFSQADWELEEAARVLGAPPLTAFALITLPRLLPAVAVSAFLAFVVSFNELVMALFLATPSTRTLPTLIWPEVRHNLSPIAAAASGVTLLLTLALLLATTRLRRAGARRLLAARP